uniref:Glycoprotein n=1 Tax=Black currant nucleorhabdovirus 1 TaxID=2079521 RepID=A0A8S3X4X5_9RHAB|nr:glycoprotein [Black currant nucleorhabdovirus 1]CAG4997686.1 glycoprotein [Black currant nucleorhabdovirus 1]
MERYSLCFTYVFTLATFLLLCFITGSKTDDGDDFSLKRQSAKDKNPVYLSSSQRGYGGDLYQPYYVCGTTSDPEGMPLSAWHYSCKQSCASQMAKQAINITLMRWDFVGPSLNVYKVTTNKVCYTSHENVWGYCSQTQTITPVPTTKEDHKNLPQEYFTPWGMPITGTKHITRSGEAECSYLSDNTRCERDYTISYREGKIQKRSDQDEEVLVIYRDGIKTDPYASFLQMNDASWFWNVPERPIHLPCGWKSFDLVTCMYTDSTDILSCPTLGYTYNIPKVSKKSTCSGDIYDIEGPVPFKYSSSEDLTDRATLFKEAVPEMSKADIKMIEGINKALNNIEATYCSSSCDLFARSGIANDDHVLDTPIGSWRFSNEDPLFPRLIPCHPTAEWSLRSPTSMCNGANTLLVENKETGHTNSWMTKRDYIILGELCTSGSQDKVMSDLKSQISEGKTINITFWTGDILSLTPPYKSPKWYNASLSFRKNPSWFSKVKLEKSMLHTQEDISRILTETVGNATDELSYDMGKSKTIHEYLFEEIAHGASYAGEYIMTAVSSIFGSLTKIVVGILLFVFIYVSIKMLILVMPIMSFFKKKPTMRTSFSPVVSDIQDSRVTWELNEIPSRNIKRNNRALKKELSNMLL